MFYLETKDGEKFFTDPKSNDKLEFEKIVEAKMGPQAAEMMNELIEEARSEGEDSVYYPNTQTVVYYDDIESMLYQIKGIISELESEKPSMDTVIYTLNQIKNTLNKL